MSESEITRKRIQAAISSQDQLIFSYDKGSGKLLTRFVVPIKLHENHQLTCKQILPKEGFRRFRLAGMKDVHRVITRMEL